MNDRERREAAEQLLELLAIYQRNRRELERREAGHEVLKVPLELRNGLLDQRERIEEAEARLQSIADEDDAGQVAQEMQELNQRQARDEIDHLQALQKVRRRHRDELERREAIYGPGQAPLALLNSLAAERAELEALEARQRHAQAALDEMDRPTTELSPEPWSLFIATPDGACYETEVPSDLLVAQLQADFLADWPPPTDAGLVRYSLRLESFTRPLEPALTLAEAGIQTGATLHLVQEVLEPTSPIGLTVQDAEGNRYTTAVRLDTRVEQLAQAFVEFVQRGGWAAIELLSSQQGASSYRPLRPDATLYEECVGDGAQLRILPAV
jgi:hypothetical protein